MELFYKYLESPRLIRPEKSPNLKTIALFLATSISANHNASSYSENISVHNCESIYSIMEEPRASADVIPLKPLLSPELANRNPVKGGPMVYTAVAQQDDPSSTWKPQASTTHYWARFALGTVWASEIASITFALIMLAAIVILLASRKDKPLPNWPSLLGINSLVAIFSSIFKVTLLYPIVQGISELKWIWFAAPRPVSDFDRFDAASRGPWGAFKLLVRRPSSLFVSLRGRDHPSRSCG